MTGDAGAPPDDVRALVATACRVLGEADQGDLIWGHVSARDPGGRGCWMKASGYGFEEVTPERVVLVDRDGNVVEGTERRHLEYPIHTEVLAARPDVASVVHTHAPSAVALAAIGAPLRPISHEGCLFGPEPVPRFTLTADLITTAELGAAVAETLGDAKACMLVNHGIVAVGPDVPQATMTALILERACAMQLRAMAAGGWASWPEDAEVRRKRDHCYSAPLLQGAWEYLVRRLPPMAPAGGTPDGTESEGR